VANSATFCHDEIRHQKLFFEFMLAEASFSSTWLACPVTQAQTDCYWRWLGVWRESGHQMVLFPSLKSGMDPAQLCLAQGLNGLLLWDDALPSRTWAQRARHLGLRVCRPDPMRGDLQAWLPD
jgi:hypothetical protein